jgi:hypothetical protein
MMMLYKRTRLEIFVVVGTLVSLWGCSVTAAGEPEKKEVQKFHAVIIRAAGYIPGTEKSEGHDAITHATSQPGNTYVFTDRLVKKLGTFAVEARVVDFSQCQNLECIYLPGAENRRQLVDIIIFAGPSYGNKLPTQLQKLVPKLKEVVKQKPDIICSSLISAKYPAKGKITIQNFNNRLKQAGVKTITGIALVPDIEEKDLDKNINDFVNILIANAKQFKQ